MGRRAHRPRAGVDSIETPNKPARPSRLDRVGTWLSLVEHSLGVRGVGSSNLPVPTIFRINELQNLFSVTNILREGSFSCKDFRLLERTAACRFRQSDPNLKYLYFSRY